MLKWNKVLAHLRASANYLPPGVSRLNREIDVFQVAGAVELVDVCTRERVHICEGPSVFVHSW